MTKNWKKNVLENATQNKHSNSKEKPTKIFQKDINGTYHKYVWIWIWKYYQVSPIPLSETVTSTYLSCIGKSFQIKNIKLKGLDGHIAKVFISILKSWNPPLNHQGNDFNHFSLIREKNNWRKLSKVTSDYFCSCYCQEEADCLTCSVNDKSWVD